MEKITALEGLLFLVGDEGAEINEILHIFDNDEILMNDVLQKLQSKYKNDQTSALQLKRYGTKYKITTKSEHKDFYEQFFSTITMQQLSNAALEVLAIIAYNQPITRAKIEYVRGVNSDGVLRKLQMYSLIDEVGREDAPGLPILFGVSPQFLDYFGLLSLDELPELKTTTIEDISEDVDIFMTKYQDTQNTEDNHTE
jgi:segregation and condensation protein B